MALVAAACLLAGAFAASAQAEYNGKYYSGCTYSWGAACIQPYQHVEDTLAMDPDHAYQMYGGAQRSNGYPAPVPDHIERDVCASVFSEPNKTLAYGWACAWGQAGEWPHLWGYAGLGTGQVYYNIALYETTNY
ncbi:MAG: hypothetical protein ACHQHO_08370 [Solirubrobacterales bacterium]